MAPLAMSYLDPKQAVIDHLAAPPGQLISQTQRSRGGWQPPSVDRPGRMWTEPAWLRSARLSDKALAA